MDLLKGEVVGRYSNSATHPVRCRYNFETRGWGWVSCNGIAIRKLPFQAGWDYRWNNRWSEHRKEIRGASSCDQRRNRIFTISRSVYREKGLQAYQVGEVHFLDDDFIPYHHLAGALLQGRLREFDMLRNRYLPSLVCRCCQGKIFQVACFRNHFDSGLWSLLVLGEERCLRWRLRWRRWRNVK